MKSIIRLLFATFCGTALLSRGELPPTYNNAPKEKDPRDESSTSFNVRKLNPNEHGSTIPDALLVYSRLAFRTTTNTVDGIESSTGLNEILGVEGTFTDEEIELALKSFYREWKPAHDVGPDAPRPALIMAVETWGAGSRLYKPYESISAEYKVDVYQIYPVLGGFTRKSTHPTPNDKRLVELIKAGAAGKP